MAVIDSMKITNKGKVLYAKAQTGVPIKFTKFKLGSGKITTENVEELTDLLEPKFNTEITSIVPSSKTKQAKITSYITNEKITEPVYICEFGLFAEDPQEGEILYGYATANEYGDYIAPIEQGAYTWMYEVNAAIGNATNVTVEVNKLIFDIGVVISDTNLEMIYGANQYEVNRKIDDILTRHDKQIADNTEDITTLKLKFAVLSGTLSFGMQNNAFLIKFSDLDDVKLLRGIHDPVNKRIYV